MGPALALPLALPSLLTQHHVGTRPRQDEIVSKAFSGREGKAYLFHTCLNARIGAPEERQLLTGMHTVADVRCGCCGALVGWTYLRAFEASQKYKEGRFILEEGAVHKVNHWE